MHKSRIWENSGFCVIKQNALSQLDFKILKSGESQKKIDDSA